jgi:hypothetical protein
MKKTEMVFEMSKEFEVLMANNKQLEAGKWVAVIDNDIFIGNTAKEAYDEAKQKYPTKEIFIVKIPENKVMLL